MQGKQSFVPGGGSRREKKNVFVYAELLQEAFNGWTGLNTQTGLAPAITEQGTGLVEPTAVTTTGL